MAKSPSMSQLQETSGIGIDVSKATLDIAGIHTNKNWHCTCANTRRPIRRFAQRLCDAGYTGKILCEATGHYHLELGLIFAGYGLDLRIVNPLVSSKHLRAQVRKTKTDAQDACVLATMCLTEQDLPPAANLSLHQVKIRLKQGQLQSLDKQLQRQTASAKAYRETCEKLGLGLDNSHQLLENTIHQLRQVRDTLQAELEALQREWIEPAELERLSQVPGFSSRVSSMVATAFDREVTSHRSWVAYAGMDVSVRQSGQFRGRGKLTKRGNPYLRKRLFNAAWGAKMNDPRVKQYYDRLRDEGRQYTEALIIIARKLLRIAFAILVMGKTYDPEIAFA